MKLSIITFALASLILAGCNKGASDAGSANNSALTNVNTAGPVASPVFGEPKTSATVNAPTADASASTPTGAFKAYYEAIQRKDSAAVKKLFSKATLKALEDRAKRTNKSFDEVFNEGLDRMSKDISQTIPESRNEKIEGNRATLEVRNDVRGSWDTARFVKEDGQWKITFADEDTEHREVK